MDIYLDNSATTKVRDEVLEEIISMYSKDYGNPSSLHRMGLVVEKKIDIARKNVAKIVNAKPDNIYFTSGGTESNNIAINGFVNKLNSNTSNIVTTVFEHASVSNIFKNYEQKGYDVRYLSTDLNGFIDMDDFNRLVDCNTGFLSIIYVNNEIGTIQKLSELIKIAKEKNKNIKIHIDAIQAFGKIKIDVNKLDIDSMSFSSHKINGPKGVGGLYLKKGSNLEGLMFGGGQEKNIRPGTENTPGIVGFGKACELLYSDLNETTDRMRKIRNQYAEKLLNSINKIKINTLLDENSAPHILSISFENIKAEVLLHYLENYNIYVSTGSACSSNYDSISSTLKSIKLSDKLIEGTIRISIGYYNTFDEIDYTVNKINECVSDIRSIIG